MKIEAGARLGPYEIVSAIGAGGMGEVWRAKDTRLDRHVAIKFLAPGFAQNAQLRIRFDREAKSISQLNHPHVCTLLDVGQGEIAEGGERLHYLVMELLEGESVADRLRRGPLPLRDVLKFGQQIASALDAAHRQGIVHRDLKPGNVMLTRTGAKLLDFGLAKSVSNVVQVDEATMQKPLTQEGTILGTFQYMAPEQLEGLEADARTDIFALGAVLYEMATGTRAFDGKTKTSVIAAIVSAQPPPISNVVGMAPPALDHVVSKCLEKNPNDRWQSAHDVSEELRWIGETGSSAGIAAPVVRKQVRIAAIGWLVAAMIAGSWIAMAMLRKPASQPRLESAIVPPEGVMIEGAFGGIALSPNGREIAFVGRRAEESRRLWIRDLGTSAARVIAGTEGASLPAWSPDGRFIVYIASEKLRRVSEAGGSPEVLAEEGILNRTDTRAGLSGCTWSTSGAILFTNGDSVWRVAAGGSTPVKVLTVPNRLLGSPWALPDGQRFLFTAIHQSQPDGVYLGSIAGGQPKRLLRDIYSNVVYTEPGLILYVKKDELRVQSVDPKSLEPRGDPTPLAEHVQYDSDQRNGLFTASSNGLLAYVSGETAGRSELVWVSREGKDLQSIAPPALYYTPRLSHDETRVAVDKSEAQTGTGDLWIFDLQRASSSRLTWDPANESGPIWTPDDKEVVFYSEKRGGVDLYERSAAGVGGDVPVLEDKERKIPLDISPDGRWLAYQIIRDSDTVDIFLFDRSAKKATPFLAGPFLKKGLQFSPDGKWVAYSSTESGQDEIYVRQFPQSSGQWIVSRGGGYQPAWSSDGRTIYYVSFQGTMMSVAVTLAPSFTAGTPVALFDAHTRLRIGFRQYSVSRDGSRFLLNRLVRENAPQPITLVQNWMNGLGK